MHQKSITFNIHTVTIGAVTYTLTPGNYTITSLTNSLNSLITNSIGVFSSSQTTNQFQYVSNAGNVTLTVAPLSLLAFLGFTNGQSGSSIIGTNSYIITFDTCIYVWIAEIGTSSLDGQQITYKIPMSGGPGSIIQYTEGSNWNQRVMFTDRSNRLDRLTITVLDRFGNILNNNGLDWTFTLEIEADT